MANNSADNAANTAYEFLNNKSQYITYQNKDSQVNRYKIVFNGKSINFIRYLNNRTSNKEIYPATSGIPGHSQQKDKNRGPIPEGKYYFLTRDISFNPLRAITNHFLGDWGLYRVPLKPFSKTNTFGRKDFYIHGGSKPGSAGCIDLGNHVENVLNPLMYTDRVIEVEVKY